MSNFFYTKSLIQSLRHCYYSNTSSAIAEIVDNSIEAGAHDIFVIISECVDSRTRRKKVCEIAILDNGKGMDLTTLFNSLRVGYSTKDSFGMGLPLAAIHMAPAVEVYSWTENGGPIETNEPVRQVWLDVNKIKTGEQDEIDIPSLKRFSEKYRHFLNYHILGKSYNFSEHGTLVVMKDCDRVYPSTYASLMKNLEIELGRKFRHLIAGGAHNIRLIAIGRENSAIDVLPNDPLFLMKSNYVLGNINDPTNICERDNVNCTEPIFAPYGDNNGEVSISVPYIDRVTGETKSSDVLIRFAKVRPEFYDQTAISTGNPGTKPIGKYVKKLEGVSVVRAGREIDFGDFGFYDKTNNPYYRWWGCEILFDPVLDEIFGVSNNKQQVQLKDNVDLDLLDSDQQVLPLWNRLAHIIVPTIKKMMEDNKILRTSQRCSMCSHN